jgi:hypothetical protein
VKNKEMKKPLPENAHRYLATNVTINHNGVWTTAFDYCVQHDAELHVITAWNPGDERPSQETNDTQNDLLRADMLALGVQPLEALGSDLSSEHSEKSWAAVGMTDGQAIELGKKYEQVAIFRINGSRQTVLGCFEEWKIRRANPGPIGIRNIAGWINNPLNKLFLQEHLDRYFGKIDEYIGYEGRQFEWFHSQSDQTLYTSNDILAIGALSVDVPATTARALIEDPEGKYKTLLAQCIEYQKKNAQAMEQSWLWQDSSPFNELFKELGSEYGVGKVVRSKLMAAKFPDLIPIRDSKVEALLECEKAERWWEPIHQLLDTTSGTVADLQQNGQAVLATPLRKLDVILWMEADCRGL